MIQLRKLSIAIALSSLHATAYAVDSFDGLGDLAGGSAFSQASGVSADGSVVVGQSRSASGAANEAFRWTDAGGMVGLGDLAGLVSSTSEAIRAIQQGGVKLDSEKY